MSNKVFVKSSNIEQVSGGINDAVNVTYDGNTNTFSFVNTDKGTSAVVSHVALSDPHTQYALKLLTGLTLVDSAVVATDNVLTGIGKLQGQLNQRVSDFNASQAVQDGRLDVLEATDAEWQELFTTGDLTNNSGTTVTNITGLTFNVVAGRNYYFEFTFQYRSAASSTGIAFTVSNGAGAAGNIAAQVNIPVAGDGTAALYTGSITSFGDLVIGNATPSANTDYIATVRGSFICTTGGTIIPQFRSENTLITVTLREGSYLLAREFT